MDPILLGLRAVAFVFAIIVLGLSAYVGNELNVSYCDLYTCYSSSFPSRMAYAVFVSVWSIIVLIYSFVVPMFMPALANKVIVGAIYAFTTLNWFCNAIVTAVWIGADGYHTQVYMSAQADVAFCFFSFACWAALTALVFMRGDDDDGKPLFGKRAPAHDPNNPELQPSTV